MFLFDQTKEVVTREIQIRDEWGVLRAIVITQGIPILTDKALADKLEVSLNILEKME